MREGEADVEYAVGYWNGTFTVATSDPVDVNHSSRRTRSVWMNEYRAYDEDKPTKQYDQLKLTYLADYAYVAVLSESVPPSVHRRDVRTVHLCCT
jgi:hypothetical protein